MREGMEAGWVVIWSVAALNRGRQHKHNYIWYLWTVVIFHLHGNGPVLLSHHSPVLVAACLVCVMDTCTPLASPRAPPPPPCVRRAGLLTNAALCNLSCQLIAGTTCPQAGAIYCSEFIQRQLNQQWQQLDFSTST